MSKLLSLYNNHFSPQNLGDLQLWLDCADERTITVDMSNKVSQIDDKSGAGNHATQGTGTKQAASGLTQLNGRNVVDFDGSDAFRLPSNLYSIPNGGNTLFVVAKTNSNSTQQRIINMTDSFSSDYGLEFSATPGSLVFFNNPSGSGVGATGITETNWNIIRARRNGVTVALSFNGVAESTNSNGADVSGIDDAALCSYDESSIFLNGSVAEIILYSRSLSIKERNMVEKYLSDKWRIALA